MAGKLIVIAGIDGSGKATQTDLLVQQLRRQGKKVKSVSFPNYGEPSAWFVERYLNGKFGSLEDIGAYEASTFYALDRYATRKKIEDWLAEGTIVICNRYVSANMAYQGAKLTEGLDEFLTWLDTLEHTHLKVPRPDKVLFLDVDPMTGKKLVNDKDDREYIEGGKREDLHEENMPYMEKVAAVYRTLAQKQHWLIIECMENGNILPPDAIAEKILATVTEIL